MSEFRFFAFTDFEYHTNRSQNLLNLPFTPFRPTKLTTTDEISHELNIPYTVFEILVAIFAIVGNLMVIIVFQRERKLRRRTNYYIVSLAMADFLVGSLGVPFAILASIGMPENLYACLFTVSLLVVLCTISIFCLVAVSVDRYWAILYPMAYSRNVRTKTAIVIISMCWLAGAVVGFLPLFGWHAEVGPNQACLFVEVMDYNYLVFLYFATIITPALIMLAFYMHIYRVIVKQVRQIVTMNPLSDLSRRSSTAQFQLTSPGRSCHGGTMLRVLGAARKRDVKATQNLSIIVLFFMICWIPLYTINCIKAFCPACEVHPKLTLFCIILSHLNSAVNPVLYAYHLKDFRAALKNLILKVMGVEVEPHVEAIHRYSVASQHRLQSIDANMRHSLQPRIYVDSPIWLRQQQQILKNQIPKCGVVSPCIGNSIGSIHQTVAAVASVPTDIEREMWNIMEASSGAEMADILYQFPDEDNNEIGTPIPPKRRFRSQRLSSNRMEGYDSPYSYDNHNYSISPEDNDVECDDVFLPSMDVSEKAVDAKLLNNSLIACAMHQSLGEYEGEYQQHQNSSRHIHLTDSSNSDYEIPQQTAIQERNASSSSTKNFSSTHHPKHIPPDSAAPTLARSESLSPVSSDTCLAAKSSTVFVIDGLDKTLRSTGHCSVLKKASHLGRATRDVNRTCASDSSSPTRELQANTVRLLATNSNSSNNSSTQSVGLVGNHKNCNSNSHNNNSNLNYYTIHHHPIDQSFCNRRHPEKFSPLKAMSNFIFPPIVKHSSLFQLFQSSNTSSNTNCIVTKTTTAATLTPQLANSLVANESRSTSITDIVTDEQEAPAISAGNS